MIPREMKLIKYTQDDVIFTLCVLYAWIKSSDMTSEKLAEILDDEKMSHILWSAHLLHCMDFNLAVEDVADEYNHLEFFINKVSLCDAWDAVLPIAENIGQKALLDRIPENESIMQELKNGTLDNM